MSIDANKIPQCEPQPAKLKLPPIENAAMLLADPTVEEPPAIIEGVLHQGSKAVLASNSKARKTWILLDLALCVATGGKWWKWPTKKGRVLYINFELQRAFVRKRLMSLCESKNITDGGNLDVWNLRGKAAPLWKLVPEIISLIKDAKYSLVIIDPIYKGLGGRDENAAGDISELCNELERVAVETGAAVVFAAHFSKGNQAGKDAMDRISGSGVWARDADAIITLTKHKDEEGNAFVVELTLRNFKEQPPFVVAWNFPLMTLREDLDPSDLKQAIGRKKTFEEGDLLAVLGKDRLTTTEWQDRSKEDGISTASFYRLYRDLRRSELIAQGADKKWESRPMV